jgi:hypothetical protein
MNWTYENKEVKSRLDIPEPTPFGFVYKITNVTLNKIYIGRKNFFTVNEKALGKKELALITDKRKSKFKTVIKESDWLNYNSSCKPLLLDIESGLYEWEKEIIEVALFPKHLTYLELKHQILNDVLGVESYNENILGKFYRRDLNLNIF